jgi:hypothetical protein
MIVPDIPELFVDFNENIHSSLVCHPRQFPLCHFSQVVLPRRQGFLEGHQSNPQEGFDAVMWGS